MPRGADGITLRTCCAVIFVTAILITSSNGVHLNAERWKRQTCRRNQYRCNSGQCLDVFLLCDGTKNCVDGSDEIVNICGRKICPSQAFKCEYGACIDGVGVCNGVEECADGSDEKPELCSTSSTVKPVRPPESSLGASAFQPTFAISSQELCPALISPSRDIECQLNGKNVNCAEPMAPGTNVTVRCNTYYTNEREFSYYNTICQSDGKWSRDVTSCIPMCGQPNPEGLPFLAGGVKAKYGEFPWHAAVYELKNGNYEQICGGSIISERVIVSAGHCFWEPDTLGNFNVQNYKVAVGKYYRAWNGGQESYKQTPEIEKIVVHGRFRGALRNWVNDIALIILKDPIRMTVGARPVCVDFGKDYERFLVPGKKGVVVGWGITEQMKPGDVLYTTSLPYVSFEDCEKDVPKPFLAFLANDKFCGGFRNGTSVCPGDGGGGFATQFRDGRWYLTGIASLGVPASNSKECNINHYTTFTKLSDYYDFIQDNLQ